MVSQEMYIQTGTLQGIGVYWCKGFCRCYPKLPQVAQCFLVVLLINLRATTICIDGEKKALVQRLR